MPGGDGTGPLGGGPGRGRGMGRGGGRGRMPARRNFSVGGGGNRPDAGPGGNCVCPSCGAKAAHGVGVPCYSLDCPKCGTKMVRG